MRKVEFQMRRGVGGGAAGSPGGQWRGARAWRGGAVTGGGAGRDIF